MEPPAAADSSSPDPTPQDHSASPSASPAKRSAWKHPSPNGPAVMDANHWPALSDAAKGIKLPDSSAPSPAPVAAPPAVANSSSSLKHSAHHVRHKSSRRSGGGGGGEHSPRDHPDRSTATGWDHAGGGGGGGRGAQRNHNNGGGRRGNGAAASATGPSHHGSAAGGGSGGGGGGGFTARRRGAYDPPFYRGPPPPMGMGHYMRSAPPPPPPPPMSVAPPFMGPPPPPVAPMRPFAGPMVFHDMASPVSPVSPIYFYGPPPPEALRGMALAPPMVGPPAYPYFQAQPEPQPEPEPQPDPEPDAEEERVKLLKQIEFYFSKENLCSDVYLRQQMDGQGWVDISLIAGFKKVKISTKDDPFDQIEAVEANFHINFIVAVVLGWTSRNACSMVQGLKKDLQYIKETLQSSSILEMKDDKIRKHNDWEKWVIPRESNPDASSSSASVPRPNVNNLTAHLGGMHLHESASSTGTVEPNHHDVIQNGLPSGNDEVPVAEGSSGQQ